MKPSEFIQMFCKNMGGTPDQMVQRIEFAYEEEEPEGSPIQEDAATGRAD
jgi:hypothetical protein